MDYKVAYTLRLLRTESIIPIAWEIILAVSKPLRLLGEQLAWLWLRNKRNGEFLEKNIRGHSMLLTPNDMGISKELTLYGFHEPVATELLCHYMKEGMNVVDIGGNLGYYALLECRLVGKEGKVVVIEPHPENFQILTQNIQRNNYQERVFLYQAAVSDCNTTTQLYTSERSNWHSLSPALSGEHTSIEVPAYTLDYLVEKLDIPVHFVRMDIEGHEIEAIKGMSKTMAVHKPSLFLELHPLLAGSDKIVSLLKHLQSLGYEVDYIVDRRRDMPWHFRFIHWEQTSLAELIVDTRITAERANLTVLFSMSAA